MAKVDFIRVETNQDLENVDIKDGQFIVSGEGKSFIDYGTRRVPTNGTPDTEMSDSSTNSIENKVVKEYIDNQIENKQDKINDTGWVDMSNYVNTNNFAIRTGYTPMVRKIGKQVFWRGFIYCNNTLSNIQGQLLTNLPQQFSPSVEIAGSGTHYELNIPYKIWIENNTIKVNEGSNIPATYNYQGYSLSDLGPYLID